MKFTPSTLAIPIQLEQRRTAAAAAEAVADSGGGGIGCCVHCGGRLHVGGPIWNGPMHDRAFQESILSHLNAEGESRYNSVKKLVGLVTATKEEIPDAPLFHTLHGERASERGPHVLDLVHPPYVRECGGYGPIVTGVVVIWCLPLSVCRF
jgi:hypothetical protein